MSKPDEGGEYSVVQFFEEEFYEYVRRFVGPEEAVKAFKHYSTSVAARAGIVRRVILTDGGDSVNMEWIHGRGVTYPPDLGARINAIKRKEITGL